MLDYRQLEALAAIVSAGNFEKAAMRLNITQSAISQRLRQLEDHVGQILVSRSTPPKATKTGERYLKHFLKVKHLESEIPDSFWFIRLTYTLTYVDRIISV